MRLILFLGLLCLSGLASSQNVLVLSNTVSGKTRLIHSGSKMYFKMGDDSEFIKGKIVQIKDSVIVMLLPDEEDENPIADIRITDITGIKKATKFHAVTRTIASITVPIGSILLISGAIPLLRKDSYQGQTGYDKERAQILTGVGAGLIVTGIIPYLVKQKVYDLKQDWRLSVQKVHKKGDQ